MERRKKNLKLTLEVIRRKATSVEEVE